MSGHSKWSTIKRAKDAKDKNRGKLFSKLIKAISVAVKTGGGEDSASNPKLRVAIEAAKAANMPKVNVDRAINKASSAGDLEEITYEGFGPGGVGVLIEVTTDNRNRTGSEIKYLLEKNDGSLGSPGSVSHGFTKKGYLFVKTAGDSEDQMLSIIELGAEDVEESDGGVDVYVPPQELFDFQKKLKDKGLAVERTELTQVPQNYLKVGEATEKGVFRLLTELEDHADVQSVYTNCDLSNL